MRSLYLAGILMLCLTTAVAAAPVPAPTWELNDLEGNTHKMEEWRGQWVLIKLGRTDCPVCAVQWEELGKTLEDLRKRKVSVLDIYVKEDKYAVKKHLAKKTLPFEPVVLYDWKGALVRTYGLTIIPHLVLVDPEGNVAWRGGFTEAPELTKLLSSKIDGYKKP